MCANVTPSAPETTDSKPDIRYKQVCFMKSSWLILPEVHAWLSSHKSSQHCTSALIIGDCCQRCFAQQTLNVGKALFFGSLQYEGEQDIELVKQLVDPELSEPYSIFTYRLFLSPWPNLCHFCYVDNKPVGVVVCKIDERPNGVRRGYLGMIVVLKEYRKLGIGALPDCEHSSIYAVACVWISRLSHRSVNDAHHLRALLLRWPIPLQHDSHSSMC